MPSGIPAGSGLSNLADSSSDDVLDGVDGTGRNQGSGSGQGSSGSITDSAGAGDLDKNQFLKILMSQLKNQNPLKPQKSGKFVNQMASLTSLEQMTKIAKNFRSINQSMQSRQFTTLLGDKVKVKTTQGESVKGKVESVKFGDNTSSVKIGGQQIETDQVASISSVGSSSGDGSSDGSGDDTSGDNSDSNSSPGSQGLSGLL